MNPFGNSTTLVTAREIGPSQARRSITSDAESVADVGRTLGNLAIFPQRASSTDLCRSLGDPSPHLAKLHQAANPSPPGSQVCVVNSGTAAIHPMNIAAAEAGVVAPIAN